MPFNVEQIRRDHPVSDVVRRAKIALDKEGDEWRGLCPFHKEKSPSFTAVDAKQYGHCFGCGWHGDVIAFVQDSQHVSFTEACEILGGTREARDLVEPTAPARESRDIYAALVPIITPEDALPTAGDGLRCYNPKRPDRPWTHYRPSMVFVYREATGQPIGVVLRIDLEDGKKITPTLRFVRLPDGTIAWSHMPFDKPRPLYGLDRLNGSKRQVLIVEGEKAADAGRRIMGDMMDVVTWPGGGKGTLHVDWKPLAGRRVVVWGDADNEGERTVIGEPDRPERPGILDQLAAIGAKSIKFVPWDHDRAQGWDAADAETEMTTAEVLAWIKARVTVYEKNPAAPSGDNAAGYVAGSPGDEDPQDNNQSPTPVNGEAFPTTYAGSDWRNHSIDDDGDKAVKKPLPFPWEATAPFRVLGHNKSTYYYLSTQTQQLVELSPSAHTPSNLMELGPLQWWMAEFGSEGRDKKKFDTEYATNSLLQAAAQKGIFIPTRLRGRGAWIDKGRPIMHLGERCYVSGKEFTPAAVKSDRYIYEASEAMDIERADPATDEEALRLVDVCRRLSWEDPLSGQLFAGWCVIAPVCGALTWRPHIWLTGPAHSGKTTALKIISRIMGMLAEEVEGSTTEAALRQTLKHDARPVLFDEIESDDKASMLRVQNILALARVSSSGGSIGKGSPTGEAIKFTARSCFGFSSINTAIVHYADDTRISRLVLRVNHMADAEDTFTALKRDISEWFTPEYAARMFARTVENLPTLLQNAITFTDAAAAVLRNARAADQIGTMLAGLYLCHSTRLVKYDAAVDWIKSKYWNEHAMLDGADDERRLLSRIALTTRRITNIAGNNNTTKDFTIGEMIVAVADWRPPHGFDRDDFVVDLGHIGIKVAVDEDGQSVFIVANKSPALAKLLEGTPWAGDWRRPLRSLEGAKATTNTYFSVGLDERGTAVPVDLLRERTSGE